MPNAISYMCQNLEKFHANKQIFLRYRAGKATTLKANIAIKELSVVARVELASAKEAGATKTQVKKLQKDLQLEQQISWKDLLEEGSHYNFPKMHILIHYCDQIQEYGQLLQYFTEVDEAYHKPLKDAYHWSNHIDANPQIFKTHARDHTFAIRDLNLALSNPGDSADLDSVPPPTTNGSLSVLHRSFVWLQGCQAYERVSNLQSLGVEYGFSDYENIICHYFKENYPILFNYNLHDPNANVHILVTSPVESFSNLRIWLPLF